MLIDTIAIIGAGPSGLAAAKYLKAEKKFSKIDIFDQRPQVGGVWNYTPYNIDNNLTVPRTKPTTLSEEPVWESERTNPIFVSPVYDFLETNIPHTLMNYSDQPFPEGSSLFPKFKVVKEYLEQYASELRPNLKLATQVIDVEPVSSSGIEKWSVTTRDLKSNIATTAEYDAVVCGNGHYSDPFIPSIAGLESFHQTYPNSISHSKFYRLPDDYKNKRVIIVGNSASGIDLSAQISDVCKYPVFVSEKEKPQSAAAAPVQDPIDSSTCNRIYVPEIAEFLVAERGVRFANGRVEKNIDTILFCTGYQYSFPFLSKLNPPVVTTGLRTENLYEHIFYYPRPSLVFLGIPQRIVPFPVAEAQSGFIARVFSGRFSLPSTSEMRNWELDMIATRGSGKLIHNLAFPKDAAYINRLHDWSMEASLNPALGNGGRGKIPPYWGEEKQWVRERFPLIKIESRKLGPSRHEVRSLAQLGFNFEQWKKENDAHSKPNQPELGFVSQESKLTTTSLKPDHPKIEVRISTIEVVP